jgi:hypothetical protein
MGTLGMVLLLLVQVLPSQLVQVLLLGTLYILDTHVLHFCVVYHVPHHMGMLGKEPW